MSTIDNIFDIIELSGINKTTIQAKAGIPNATFDKTLKRGTDLSQENLNKFLKVWSDLVKQLGYEVIDNYDVFGHKGKAIVKKGTMLFDGKYIEVVGKDNMDKGVSSDLRDQYLTFLQSVSEKQNGLAKEIDAFLKQTSGSNLAKSHNAEANLKGAVKKLQTDSAEKKGKNSKGTVE